VDDQDEIIAVRNLCKSYQTYKRTDKFFRREKVTVDAVKDVSFYVKKGEIAGILGPNGAGKSTTIKMLTGSLYPTSGDIKVLDYTPVKDRKRYVRHIGAVFGQKSQLIWDIPPIDSFKMNKEIYTVSDKDFQLRLASLTEQFEIRDVIQKPTRVLSLGERMKCEFVMAMLHKPEIVFLDEPTIGLDVIAKQKIRTFIKEMNRQGTTFILTTHDLDDVEQLAQKVVIINHGQKVFDDSLIMLQKSLGAKKIIELTLTKPSTITEMTGITAIEQRSELEVTLEVDVDRIPITVFIQKLAEKSDFSDISIKSLPMETIITQIYSEKDRAQN
jgi:ABC-2 type transport system ATP-binding protein